MNLADAIREAPPPGRAGTPCSVAIAVAKLGPADQIKFAELLNDPGRSGTWLADVLSRASGQDVSASIMQRHRRRDHRGCKCRP